MNKDKCLPQRIHSVSAHKLPISGRSSTGVVLGIQTLMEPWGRLARGDTPLEEEKTAEFPMMVEATAILKRTKAPSVAPNAVCSEMRQRLLQS